VAADDGAEIVPGTVYVARPDHHLTLEDGRVRVRRGPRENGVRPAIDPLFRSAAEERGRRVVGAVLSGTLDDGTAGLAAIKARGGISLAQDPDDAQFSGMPASAIEGVGVDRVLRADQMGRVLLELTREHLPEEDEMERDATMDEDAAEAQPRPSPYSCPECGGVLNQAVTADVPDFRCRVGHAYTADALLSHQSSTLEEALWVALRTLEESAQLADRLRDHARSRERRAAAEVYARRSADARARADLIKRALETASLTLPASVPLALATESDAGAAMGPAPG
jgi:two-component system chemotaxis response regulator CheB